MQISNFLVQARGKIQRLEQSIQQAQTMERQMLDMSRWMEEVTQLLQERLDADMLAGDVPEEHEVCLPLVWAEIHTFLPVLLTFLFDLDFSKRLPVVG